MATRIISYRAGGVIQFAADATRQALLYMAIGIAAAPLVLIWTDGPWTFAAFEVFLFSLGFPLYKWTCPSLFLACRLDEVGIELLDRGRRQSYTRWSDVKLVRTHGRGNERIELFGKDQELLMSIQFGLMASSAALRAIMLVRLPEDLCLETIQPVPSGTKRRRWTSGALLTPIGVVLLGWCIREVRAETPLDLIHLAFFAVACAGLVIGGMNLAVAAQWKELVVENKFRLNRDLETTLYPYLHWILADNPIPGDHSFQYRAGITPRSVREQLLTNWIMVGMVTAICNLFWILFLLGNARTSVLSVLAAGLLINLLPASLLLLCLFGNRKTRSHIVLVGDEIVLEGPNMFIWDSGEFVPVKIVKAPDLPTIAQSSSTVLTSNLVLEVKGNNVSFDASAMLLLK